jgi:hypothetical protein
MPPEDELARQQERQLAIYTDKRVARFLRLLEASRADLQATIAEPDSFNAFRINSLIQQIEDIERRLASRIQGEIPSSQELAPVVQGNLEDMFKTIAPSSQNISVSIGSLNTETLYRFSQVELKHVSQVMSANISTIKSVLYSQIGLKGRNPSQVAKELAGKNGTFKGQYGHIETILRTETSTVYNAQSLRGIQYVNDTYALTIRKRIVETIDAKRNHPISSILNNQVREMGDPFQASVAEVAAKARQLKKTVNKDGTVGGILKSWPIQNGFYTGERLPAHFRERGVVVPTVKDITPP